MRESFEEIFIGLKMFASWLFSIFVIAFSIALLFFVSPLGRDDSDEGYGWFDNRSNMRVTTDNLTGCQYLGSERGGITPRVDSTGKHICRKH